MAEQTKALADSNQELEVATEKLLAAQDELARTEKLVALGQLSGSVAHDLRNPLSSIKNASFSIRKKITSERTGEDVPKLLDLLDVIESLTARSDKVIDDLMRLARVSPSVLAPTRINVIIERLCKLS